MAKKISVSGVLASKSPRLEKWIPRPIIKWLERTIRQGEINHVLGNYGDLPPMDFLREYFGYLRIDYRAIGLDELDPSGRYIFAANHPFGGMDGMMLAHKIGQKFGDVRVIVNDILMYLDPLRPIFVPVNKHGAQKGEYAKAFNEAFEGDIPVLTFPAGLCSRCGSDGVVADLEWRPNFIKRAVQSGRSIVPVYVEGRLSKKFYRLANWRKRLGIKVNIEMLLLPGEMFGQKGRTFRLIFGTPVSAGELRAAVQQNSVEAPSSNGAGSERPNASDAQKKRPVGGVSDYAAMAAEVRRLVYELGKN